MVDYMDSEGCRDLQGDEDLVDGTDPVGTEDSNSRMDSDGRTADGRQDSVDAMGWEGRIESDGRNGLEERTDSEWTQMAGRRG